MIRRFSPHNYSFMEFRSQTDYELAAKIRGDHPLLEDSGIQFRRELHMTDDNHLFRKLGGKKAAARADAALRRQDDSPVRRANIRPAILPCVEEAKSVEELLREGIYRLANSSAKRS